MCEAFFRTSINNKNKYTANLMISKANFNHSGFYRCSAEFDGRSAEALLQIKIYREFKKNLLFFFFLHG